MFNWCLCFHIKICGAVHGCYCALFISKLLLLLSLWYFILTLFPPLSGLPPGPPNQLDHIEALTINFCFQIRSPPWYCRTWLLRPRLSTPFPNDEIWGQECPSNFRPIISGGNLRIDRQPGNGASTITTPIPTPIKRPRNLWDNGDRDSYSI